ncbi:MAG: hypothetical protein IJM25_11650 [Eubacterium sp.]|nr:hypothetical protein [Eubacterium sp.]
MKRKNRIYGLLLACMLIFGLVSCGKSDVGEPASGDADYLGTYTETTFKNERFNVIFTKPEEKFEFAMLDDILTANDIKEEDFSNARVPEIVAEGKEYMVMYGGNGATQCSTSMLVGPFADGKDPEAFVQDAKQQISDSLKLDPNIKVKECDLKTGSPVGYDKYMVYTFSANDQTFYTEQFFIFTDVNMASITISATSEGQIMTMHSSWRKLK